MSALEPPSYEQIPLEVYEGELESTVVQENLDRRSPEHSPPVHACKSSFEFTKVCDMQVSPPSWLVDGYIETDAIANLFGPPTVGKSFIALDIACCVATGNEYHGHQVQQGAVFVIAGEGHNGLARRCQAWAEHNETSLSKAPLYFSKGPADLGSKLDAARVAEAVQRLVDEHGVSPALIIIDTLARNFRGEENSATDIGRFVQLVDDHLRRKWKATIIIVHHSGKNSELGARGSSALRAAVDAEYQVTREIGSAKISLIPRKMKDAVEPPPLTFELVSVEMRDDADRSISGAALALTSDSPSEKSGPSGLGQNQRLALDTLKEMHAEIAARLAAQGRKDHPVHVLFADWQDRCLTLGLQRNRFKEAYDSLLSRSLIDRDGPHVYAMSETSEPLEKTEIRTAEKDSSEQSAPPLARPKYSGDL